MVMKKRGLFVVALLAVMFVSVGFVSAGFGDWLSGGITGKAIDSSGNYVCKSEQKIGDANGDGVVDATDVQIITDMTLALTDTPDEICCFDTSKDGAVSSFDSALINKGLYAGGGYFDVGNCPVLVETAPIVTCTDSDGGVNHSVKGEAIRTDGINSTKVEDRCVGNTLYESSCSGEDILSALVSCPAGCEDGACLEDTASSDNATNSTGDNDVAGNCGDAVCQAALGENATTCAVDCATNPNVVSSCSLLSSKAKEAVNLQLNNASAKKVYLDSNWSTNFTAGDYVVLRTGENNASLFYVSSIDGSRGIVYLSEKVTGWYSGELRLQEGLRTIGSTNYLVSVDPRGDETHALIRESATVDNIDVRSCFDVVSEVPDTSSCDLLSDNVRRRADELRASGKVVVGKEGGRVFRNQYLTVISRNNDGDSLLKVTTVMNATTGFSNDRIKFQEVLSGNTYDATITQEGQGHVTVAGNVYSVSYSGPQHISEDDRFVTVNSFPVGEKWNFEGCKADQPSNGGNEGGPGSGNDTQGNDTQDDDTLDINDYVILRDIAGLSYDSVEEGINADIIDVLSETASGFVNGAIGRYSAGLNQDVIVAVAEFDHDLSFEEFSEVLAEFDIHSFFVDWDSVTDAETSGEIPVTGSLPGSQIVGVGPVGGNGESFALWMSNGKLVLMIVDNSVDSSKFDFVGLLVEYLKKHPSTLVPTQCTEGCLSSVGKCLAYGVRASGNYCSITEKVFLAQRADSAICENNFECGSNVCVSGQCVEAGLFKKFLNWIGTFTDDNTAASSGGGSGSGIPTAIPATETVKFKK